MDAPTHSTPPGHAFIAGGGVGGLSAALALARIGWRVSLFEAAQALEDIGAGLQISPNASRILRQWNVLGDVSDAGLKPEALRIMAAHSGAPIAKIPFGLTADHRWGAPYLVSHRADLINALYHACLNIPAIQIHTHSRVIGFAHIDKGVEIAVQTAHAVHNLRADMLIGADGLRSTIRAGLGLGLNDKPVYSGNIAWRTLIPAQNAPDFAREPLSYLWLGPNAHCVHYPLRHNSVINLVAITEDKWRETPTGDDWNLKAERAALLRRFDGWHKKARELIASATEWRCWPLYDRPPIARWHDRHVALLGDGAHPMVPFLAQGAAMAIEDAEVLARALVRADHNVENALRDYTHTRSPRASAVQLAARKQGEIYHLNGIAGLGRNMVLRTMSKERLLSELDWIYNYRVR
jgi:salicylate hydroxylase